MNIKMVVTDLDRTLLRGDQSLSGYSISVIKRLREKGIYFTPATARPESAVRGYIKGLEFDHAVYYNGARIRFSDGSACHFGFSSDAAAAICNDILRDIPGRRLAVEMGDRLYANFDIAEIWPDIKFTHSNFSDLPRAAVEKVLIPIEPFEDLDFSRYLPSELYMQISESCLGMVLNRKATKLNGIKAICEKLGISIAEVAAFGDDLNDCEMLAVCGFGIAVSNALDTVKKSAGSICLSNEEDGVADWIERNLL